MNARVHMHAELAPAGVWSEALPAPGPGPDSAFGLVVSGSSVYVAGSLADPAVSAQTDGFVAQLDAATGQLLASGGLANGSLAAITIDPTGNVYAAGWRPDPVLANH